MSHTIFKSVVPVLIFLLIFPFHAATKQKKGAILVIYTMDGQKVKGELLRVKDRELLIMKDGVNTEATFSIDHIDRIRIKRKYKFIKSVGMGFAIGAGVGATAGLISPLDHESGLFFSNKTGQVVFMAVVLGILGLGAGGIYGLAASSYKTYPVKTRTEKNKEKLLKKLGKKARFQ
jgi:hypothetical protein